MSDSGLFDGRLLDGRQAIVTGGASGIGAAAARRMAAAGAVVTIFDRNRSGAQAVADEFGGAALEVDVTDRAGVEAAVDQAAEAMGGLTTIFNNAGIGSMKPLDQYSEKEWDLLVGVNLKGTFNGIGAAIPHLRAAAARGEGASIVNMASVSGLRPTRGEAPYAAAKAGVIALTMSGALEYGPDGVRVNCVSPGWIRTGLTDFAFAVPAYIDPLEAATPLGRAGTADDIADVVVFLASDLARYVTGQNLVVDGGSMLPNAQVDHVLRDLLGGGSLMA
jgi:NAD(P)-dependent dehydrogenase (short-subunit alcohol dehydrogenase family)